MQNLIVTKNKSLTFSFFVGICLFGTLFGTSLETLPTQNDNYFRDFAKSIKSDYVKYSRSKKELIVFAYPPVVADVVLAFVAAFTGVLGAGFGVAASDMYRQEDKIAGYIVAGCFGTMTLIALYYIIQHYNIRNGFVPYLAFDSEGLQVFGKHVLDWKDVCKVDGKTIHKGTSGISIELTSGVYYNSANTHVTNYTVYMDKFGVELYRIYEYDRWLPYPVSFENVKAVFNHCISTYGSQNPLVTV
ncbi:MAG: hypothetical protein US49_C0006G0143 [candidate division TM6 bacterium GW2011_GWF2_37_49]|nr:MAG: hypothetical protein US49_C0006G0143 [candidate division TM6 bacterium GW2011_GWF2_37_49]